MKVFVTGGSGFIGRCVVRCLAERGHDLLVLTHSSSLSQLCNNDVRSVQGSMQNITKLKETIKKFAPDIFIHLAWEGLPDYSLAKCRKNLDYGLDLYSLAAEVGCASVITAGSCWEYESREGRLTEDAALGSGSIFPAAKTALRYLGEAIARQNGFRFYWLRLFFVYGPGQRNTSLVPYIIESLMKGELPTLRALFNSHDFVFIDDVARAIVEITECQPENTVYNVGSGRPIAVKDVVRMVHEAMQINFNEDIFTKTSEPISEEFWADVSRIQKNIGWQPNYDIKTGLMETVNFFMSGY